MPVAEMNAEINKQNVPNFESVATTGIGVEETLKGITQLVLAHLIKKYGLEGSEPLEREIQILNANTGGDRGPADSLWDEEDVPAAEPLGSSKGVPAKAVASRPAPPTAAPFVIDDSGDDDDIPLVATELIGGPKTATAAAAKAPAPAPVSQQSPFDDVSDYFSTSGAPPSIPPMEVPMTSIEMAIPEGILSSLPDLSGPLPASSPSPSPSSTPSSAVTATPPVAERRSTDGLVKEVTVPINLTMDELRKHRRLKLKITLDVNLLP